MGEYKYAAIGREVRVFAAPSDEEMTALRQVFDNV
jgi:hypothetical protein